LTIASCIVGINMENTRRDDRGTKSVEVLWSRRVSPEQATPT
jgi:hypothetical protein